MAADKMTLTGACYLYICGHHINVELINSKIGILPSASVKEGMPGEYGGIYQNDIWWVETSFSDDPCDGLKSLLSMLKPAQEFIAEISLSYDVSILCSINSDLAQIGFTLSPEILCAISRFGLRLDVSILSWGEVANTDNGERHLITDLFPRRIEE
jgi:hypothetical protein